VLGAPLKISKYRMVLGALLKTSELKGVPLKISKYRLVLGVPLKKIQDGVVSTAENKRAEGSTTDDKQI
jgi:hypothetical protein